MSRTTPHSIFELRVALAGLPAGMRLERGRGFDLAVTTVGELRTLEQLSYPLDVSIPYRLVSDSRVVVKRYDPPYGSDF